MVRVRQVHVRGRNRRYYGPHVRLRPGPPEPKCVFRGRDGWCLVLPLDVRPAMPPDVVDAFVRAYRAAAGRADPDRADRGIRERTDVGVLPRRS
ncbi:hypothetical protein [Streptomyces sp. NPDC002845]